MTVKEEAMAIYTQMKFKGLKDTNEEVEENVYG